MTVGRYPWRRAVHVISTPNISLFDKNATRKAADRGWWWIHAWLALARFGPKL